MPRFQSKKEYMEIYRENNKDRISLLRKEWYEKNKSHVFLKSKEWASKNPEKRKSICKKYSLKNKKRENEYQQKWAEEHPNLIKIYKKKSHENRKRNHPEAIRLNAFNQRVRRKYIMDNGDTITLKVINEILIQQKGQCYYCLEKLENYHIEHLIPLAKGGHHKEYNLVLACPSCNLRKYNKMPDEFIKNKKVA